MFTNTLLFPKELLPCNVGDTIYTIESNIINWSTKERSYCIEEHTCEGFVIKEEDGAPKIYPAYNTWDGWCEIIDGGYRDDKYGYYLDRNEALKKKRELDALEIIKKKNRWIEEL